MHTYIHTHYKYIYIYILCIHTYIHTYIHAYIHTYIHAYMHTCIHMYICIHTNIFLLFSHTATKKKYCNKKKGWRVVKVDLLKAVRERVTFKWKNVKALFCLAATTG